MMTSTYTNTHTTNMVNARRKREIAKATKKSIVRGTERNFRTKDTRKLKKINRNNNNKK